MSEPTNPDTSAETPAILASGEVPTFWGPAVPYCAVQTTARTVSDTAAGESLALLFSAMTISLQDASLPLSDVALAAVRAPLERVPDGQTLTGYSVSIRGFVRKSADARIVFFLSLGGQSRLIEFGFGDDRLSSEESGDFTETVDITLSPEAVCGELPTFCCLVTLLAERAAGSAIAMATLDSLDIVAVFSAKEDASQSAAPQKI